MSHSRRLTSVLQSGGFAVHNMVGRLLGVGFTAQAVILSVLIALTLLACSALDSTLILPGRDIGLLEHPTIWAFLALQTVLPLTMRHSMVGVLRSRHKLRETNGGTPGAERIAVESVLNFVRLGDAKSRGLATLLYSAGLAAFVWNTYQNQLPGVLLPFDFWDSSRHLCGFWLTRAYKLYLFVGLFPYVALVHLALVMSVLGIVRRARLRGALKLIPFHPDGTGGLGFIPRLITSPIVVTLLTLSFPMAAALGVHRALDPTPLIGLAMILSFAVIAYLTPILALRSDIVALKRTEMEKLRNQQQACYAAIAEQRELTTEVLTGANEALEYFDQVCARVQAIPNYPHWKRLLRYTGIALTPSALTLALKGWEAFGPILGRLLVRP